MARGRSFLKMQTIFLSPQIENICLEGRGGSIPKTCCCSENRHRLEPWKNLLQRGEVGWTLTWSLMSGRAAGSRSCPGACCGPWKRDVLLFHPFLLRQEGQSESTQPLPFQPWSLSSILGLNGENGRLPLRVQTEECNSKGPCNFPAISEYVQQLNKARVSPPCTVCSLNLVKWLKVP